MFRTKKLPLNSW